MNHFYQLQSSPLFYFALVLGLLLSMVITYFIARNIGKRFSERYQRWVYFVISLYPLSQFMELELSEGFTLKNLYLWFWFLYWLFCLTMFWGLRIRWLRRHKEAQ